MRNIPLYCADCKRFTQWSRAADVDNNLEYRRCRDCGFLRTIIKDVLF